MTKPVNYTPEQTAELVTAYSNNPTRETVEHFAEKFGKTARSIVAKLSREKVYQRKEYVSKTGEKPQTKEQIVAKIAETLGTQCENLSGIEKATKAALILILNSLKG